MKIIFINPFPHPESMSRSKPPVPPIGLMSVAAFIEKNGYDVKIIDAHVKKLSLIKISKEIILQKPDIVGITTDSINYYDSLRIANLVKQISNAIVILGGPHATLKSQEMLKYPQVDIAVIGEGELTLLEILQRIEKGQSLKGCKGCVIKENGEIINNQRRERISDLDSLPLPARHLVPYRLYPRKYNFGGILTPVDTINTSRGCPYNCSFCSSREIWGIQYKTRSPKKIVDEIEYLIKKYGTKGIYFREDNFTLNKKRVYEICHLLIKRNINIEWECSSRVDLVNRDLLKQMYRAGCRAIWYGIESGSLRVLKMINKGITLEQIRKTVKISKEAGLKVGGSFMIGIPGETKKDIKMTYNLIKELALYPTNITEYIAIPESKIYREVLEKRLFDSAYGDILFVKLKGIDKRFLEYIKLKVRRDLLFIIKRENLRSSPEKVLVYIKNLIKNPRKIVALIKNIPKKKIMTSMRKFE